MIILLVGKPGVGKSTAIEKFIHIYKDPATWVVTTDIRGPDNSRLGFSATNSAGVTRTISHKTDIQSDVIVGVNHVDVAALDAMFSDALRDAGARLTIVDEIGPMQLLSPAFAGALDDVFERDVDLVASIHYKDEQLARYRDWPTALLLEVSPENRDMLPQALVFMAKNRQVVNGLSGAQQDVVHELLKTYVAQAQLVQIQKLMEHAVHYVAEGKVKQLGPGRWAIAGKHDDHILEKIADKFVCDCDLFNGRNQYQGKSGECSHIQAVTLLGQGLDR